MGKSARVLFIALASLGTLGSASASESAFEVPPSRSGLRASLEPTKLRISPLATTSASTQLGISPIPKFAFKLGGGVVGTESAIFFGVEATLPKVPIIPSLRVDFDAWGSNLGFNGDYRGNALSALITQDLGPVYFGFGGGLVYDRRLGDDYSGVGGKAVVGARLPIVNLRLEGNLWVTGNGTLAAVMMGIRF